MPDINRCPITLSVSVNPINFQSLSQYHNALGRGQQEKRLCSLQDGGGNGYGLEERELVLMSNRILFDGRINHNAEIEDLRLALMADFLNRVGNHLMTMR